MTQEDVDQIERNKILDEAVRAKQEAEAKANQRAHLLAADAQKASEEELEQESKGTAETEVPQPSGNAPEASSANAPEAPVQ